MRHMERDPEGAQDSMKKALVNRNLSEAKRRGDWYEKNARLDTLQEIDLNYAQLVEILWFVFESKGLKI